MLKDSRFEIEKGFFFSIYSKIRLQNSTCEEIVKISNSTRIKKLLEVSMNKKNKQFYTSKF